jgi:two-component system cell cycle sensor histidine kinase/response regulator CckA
MIETATSSSGHILVMDDEELVRDVSKNMLETFGFTVELAFDGREAVEKYISADESGNPFDIVIMDLTIPGGMGGKEAVNNLLAINSNAKVIVSSGYSTDPILANYGDYGFKGRLVKPFQIKDLKKELTRVMEVA